MSTIAPLVWLNGFPGTGKLTVAKRMVALDENIILVDNHSMIDPVEARFPRTHPAYQAERKLQRSLVFHNIVHNEDLFSRVVIFTDFQSNNDLGRDVALEYQNAAHEAGRPFVPVYLFCEVEENLKRTASAERMLGETTKLTSVEMLQDLRSRCELFTFEDYPSFTIDVTYMSPRHAAEQLWTCINKHRGDGGHDVFFEERSADGEV